MTYFKAFPARVPPSIDRTCIDGGGGGGLPLMLKADEPATISVRVCGLPAPVVRWYVGPTLVQTDRTPTCAQPRLRDDDGCLPAEQHSLTVDTVTDELEQGVTVVATNDAGQDIISFSVKTYKGRKRLSAVLSCFATCVSLLSFDVSNVHLWTQSQLSELIVLHLPLKGSLLNQLCSQAASY